MALKVACLPVGPSPAQISGQRISTGLHPIRPSFIGCQLQLRSSRRTRTLGRLAIDGLASSASEGLRAVPTLERETETSVYSPPGVLNEEDDDDRVVTTFRWPAALGGQDVSVVGETDTSRPQLNPETFSLCKK